MKTRIISVILTLSMLLPFCFSFTPKAQAIAPALAAQQVGAALASVLIANGYKLDSIGLTPGDVTNNLNAFWQQYRSFMGVEDFVLDSGGTAQRYDISIQGGLIFLSDHGADLVDGFLDWIFGNAASAGVKPNEVYTFVTSALPSVAYLHGSAFKPTFSYTHPDVFFVSNEIGTALHVGESISFGGVIASYLIESHGDSLHHCVIISGEHRLRAKVSEVTPDCVIFGYDTLTKKPLVSFFASDSIVLPNAYFGNTSVEFDDVFISVTIPETSALPDTSTMTEEQSLVIDTGIQADNIEDMLDKILQSVAAGTLTVTAAIENTTTGDGGADPKPDEGSLSKQLITIISLLGGSILLKLSGIFDKVAQIPNAIQTGVKSMTDGITGALTGTWDGITDTVSGIWESIKSIPSVIGKAVTDLLTGIKTLVVSLVVPSEATLTAFQTAVETKLPFIPDLRRFASLFQQTIENPSLSVSQRALSPFIYLANKEGGTYGDGVINFLNFDWYISKYKPIGDQVVLGFFWCVFLWNLFGRLPAIINGASGTLVSGKRGED